MKELQVQAKPGRYGRVTGARLYLTDREAPDAPAEVLQSKFNVKIQSSRWRGTGIPSESHYLCIELEPHQRHAMLVIKEIGIDAKSCKGRDTLIVKWTQEC
eukprot:5816399-Amphidinium_carterae.1